MQITHGFVPELLEWPDDTPENMTFHRKCLLTLSKAAKTVKPAKDDGS